MNQHNSQPCELRNGLMVGENKNGREIYRQKAQGHLRTNHRSSKGRRHRSHKVPFRFADRIERIIQLVLGILVIALPLPMGGMDRWAWSGAGLILCLLLVLWAVMIILRGQVDIPKSSAFWVFGLCIIVGLVQSIPYQPLVEALSPCAAFNWAQAKAAGAQVSRVTISLLPFETLDQLWLLFVLFVGFFLFMSVFKSEKELFLLALAVMTAGAVNAIAGMVQYFSDTQWVLWMYRTFHLHALAGTFRNKNHFAFLVNMGLLVGAGAFLSALFAHRRFRNDKAWNPLSLRSVLVRYRFLFQVSLGIFIVFAIVSILFTYSRAGIVCGLTSLMTLLFYSWWVHKGGGRVLILGALTAVAVYLVSFYGLNSLIERLESAASLEDSSYLARLDIWSGAWQLIKDYHWLGIGLGAFRYVNPIHESGILIDKLAFYAHNDWLELFCLLGVPVGLTVVGIIVGVLFGIVRRLYRSRITISWLGVGAFFALLYAAAHEVFDFSLQLPGDALAFLAVLTLAIRASQIAAVQRHKNKPVFDRVWHLGPVGKVMVSLAVVIVATTGVWNIYPIYAAGWSHSKIMQKITLGAPKTFWEPANNAKYLEELSEDVLKYTPHDLVALTTLAAQKQKLAIIKFRKKLAETLSAWLGFKVKPEDVLKPGMTTLADQAAASFPAEVRKEIEDQLRNSTRLFARAAGQAPTNGHILAVLARSWEREGMWSGFDRRKTLDTYDLAHRLYPTQGTVTMICAQGYWREYKHLLKSGHKPKAELVLKKAIKLFRSALDQNPQLTEFIYEALWDQFHQVKLLDSITPITLPSQERLYRFLFRQNQWGQCLKIMDRISDLNQKRPERETIESLGAKDFVRRDRRSKQEVAFTVQKRRVTLLGALGRWKERNAALNQLRKTMHLHFEHKLDEARELIRKQKFHMARLKLDQLLEKDPFWPQVILLQCQTAVWLGESLEALELIFRLTYMDQPVSNALLKEALELTQKIDDGSGLSGGKSVFPLFKAVQAGLLVRLKRPAEALKIIDDFWVNIKAGECMPWSQQHMLYYFSGLAHQMLGNRAKAMKQYIKTLDICPNHLWASRRLLELSDDRELLAKVFNAGLPQEQKYRMLASLSQAQKLLAELDKLPAISLNFGALMRLKGIIANPAELTIPDATEISFYWESIGLFQGVEPLIRSRYFTKGGTAFWDNHRLTQGREVAVWRLGQLVKVSRRVSPMAFVAKQYKDLVKPGEYYLEIKPVAPGATNQGALTPLARLIFKVFTLKKHSLVSKLVVGRGLK